MSIQINKSAYEKLIKEDIEWLLSNTKDSLERRHIVEVLNYSPERLYASGSSEIPNDLEEAADEFANQDCVTFISRKKGFIAGAKWQKEQMISALKNDGDLPIEFIDKFHEIDRSAFQNGQKNMKEQMMKEAEKPCHTVEEWMEHIKNADQLTKDIFSKGPYNVLYDALNHPYRDCYDAIKEFGELCYQTALEDMMKEAVEAEVTETCGISSVWIKTKQFKPGQKVKIIFVKED